jgi:hypothetical protein
MSRDLSGARTREELTAATLKNVRVHLAEAHAGAGAAGAWVP